jgi:hypothetical protein
MIDCSRNYRDREEAAGKGIPEKENPFRKGEV